MSSKANWRGDVGSATGFSNVYDLDNIYLSDRGWAYRHYNSEDTSDYWDEVLTCSNPPTSDNPDAFGIANPTFMPDMGLEGFSSDGVKAPFARPDGGVEEEQPPV
jgi:hypothetical protein